MFARVGTVREVAFALTELIVVTLVVERFEVPVTFRVVPKSEEAFRVFTLVVERFEAVVTLRAIPESEEAFRVVALVVARFEVP